MPQIMVRFFKREHYFQQPIVAAEHTHSSAVPRAWEGDVVSIHSTNKKM
jgi:hypothetical protein